VNRLPAVRLGIPASQSIGVVTFSGDPQRLIENQARRSDPSLEGPFRPRGRGQATMSYEETPRVGVDPKQ
jgi:hypothetical protein